MIERRSSRVRPGRSRRLASSRDRVARVRREIDPDLQRAVIELRAAVAANVRALARRRGLSLNRLVDFAGVTRSAFYRALSGRGTMTVDTIAKLAVALEVAAARLLETREGAPRAGRHDR